MGLGYLSEFHYTITTQPPTIYFRHQQCAVYLAGLRRFNFPLQRLIRNRWRMQQTGTF